MCTIADLIKHRRHREKLVRREIALRLPTVHGTFDLFAFSSIVDQDLHMALTVGGIGVEENGVTPDQDEPVLVRVHSECFTGDVLESALCDCGSQLHTALRQIVEAVQSLVPSR